MQYLWHKTSDEEKRKEGGYKILSELQYEICISQKGLVLQILSAKPK